jgi:hypothetical protein
MRCARRTRGEDRADRGEGVVRLANTRPSRCRKRPLWTFTGSPRARLPQPQGLRPGLSVDREHFRPALSVLRPSLPVYQPMMMRGTGSSNPSPSSRESYSLPHPPSKVDNPGFPRGCARLAWRPGRQRRAGVFRYCANRRQYLCRAIFQYRSAADGAGENATPIPTKSGLLRA